MGSLSAILMAAAIALAALSFSHLTPVASDRQGERGLRFRQFCSRFPAFRWLHPELSRLAGLLDRFLPLSFRQTMNARLQAASYPMGLNVAEAGVLCLLSGTIIGFLVSRTIVLSGGLAGIGWILGFLTGVALPIFRIEDLGNKRTRTILRQLPMVMEMLSLCLRAGMDFNGALCNVASRLEPENPLRFELEHVYRCLQLGRSRSEALTELSRRTVSVEMDRFVASVILADKKGTSLSEVLSIQSTVMRTRRSQKAEQAAARASLLLLGPLMLIFLAVFVLLLGPFILQSLEGTLLH